MASKIAHGLPYQYGSPDSKIFRAPLYPLFLAPFAWLDERGQRSSLAAVMAARITGCAIGVLCIALIIRFANRLSPAQPSNRFGDAGVWAGLLVVLYPGAIGMSLFILSEAIFCPLMLLSMGCTSRAMRDAKSERWELAWTWLLLSGAMSGAACLARPSWSLWPAVLFPYLVISLSRSVARTNARKPWQSMFGCFLFCVGICLVMCPWWTRNFIVTGKFVPTTLQVGASLYDGWHPGATGSSDEGMEFVNAFIVEQKAEDARNVAAGNTLESTLEWRLDRRLKNAAIQWAIENSSDAMWLGLVKFVKTWSPLPVAKELGSDAVRWLEAIGYCAIMCFAGIGMWQCRSRIGAWLYAMPCVYFAVLHVFFIGSVRYRQPAVLAICVLGGIGCAALVRWIGHGTKLDGSIVANDVTVDRNTN